MEYTEEEKKAIERCNELKKDCHKEWIGISNQVAIDIVLNLLEKQQEEIEKKDKRIHYLENETRGIVEKEFHKAQVDLYKNYIPKEAIREYLLSLKEKRTINDNGEYTFEDLIDFGCGCIKELLGE